MKIAQIAPLAESVPPKLYGGTERVVSYLTEELVRLGHDVTLFASGDSQTSAELVACVPRALRLDRAQDPLPHLALMLERVRQRIAAKVDPADEKYWREHIVPKLNGPFVQFIGEVDEATKPAFLGNASALLFPVDWPEPFGLAMVEAMSCGTPVIAWPHGAVSEVVEDGLTGTIVDTMDAAVAALERVARLDRARVRSRFEERFSAARMAQDYLSVYRALGRRRAVAAA